MKVARNVQVLRITNVLLVIQGGISVSQNACPALKDVKIVPIQHSATSALVVTIKMGMCVINVIRNVLFVLVLVMINAQNVSCHTFGINN